MSSFPDPMRSVVQRNEGICLHSSVQQYALGLGKRTTIRHYWQKKLLSPKSDRVRGEGRGERGEGRGVRGEGRG